MRGYSAARAADQAGVGNRSQIVGRLLLLAGLMLLPGIASLPGSAGALAQSQSPSTSKAPTDAGRSATPMAAVPEKKQEVADSNDEYMHSPMVVKLGSMLGMGPEAAATAFTVFNFLILVAGIGVAVVKIVPKALRERSTRIQRQLVEARTATEEANMRLSAVESRLSRLDGQIANMHAEAEVAAEREARRVRETVEEEKGKIVAAAEAEIQAATLLARRQIQQHAAELAIEHAARKLTITAETDRALIGNFARQLSGEKGGN